jgi:malate synthase
MPTPEVIDRVQSLHEHLEKEPNKALETIRPQLQQIVQEPHDAAHYNSLSDRLRAAYDSLETDHPTLAAAVQAAMNALNAAGL